MTTYNLYIPGPYENFAEQATEVPHGLLVTVVFRSAHRAVAKAWGKALWVRVTARVEVEAGELCKGC